MDFTTYALAYSRLAKYQIAWWGHPITSGIDTIDYYFGLDIEIEGEKFYNYQSSPHAVSSCYISYLVISYYTKLT